MFDEIKNAIFCSRIFNSTDRFCWLKTLVDLFDCFVLTNAFSIAISLKTLILSLEGNMVVQECKYSKYNKNRSRAAESGTSAGIAHVKHGNFQH